MCGVTVLKSCVKRRRKVKTKDSKEAIQDEASLLPIICVGEC